MKPQPYGPFAYKPINNRPELSWPDGARVAFWVVPNIEVFALNEKIPGGVDNIPDVSAWGRRRSISAPQAANLPSTRS